MARKKNIKKVKEKAKKQQQDFAPEDEKPFDFGGLPARDLKKNLGCG